MKSIFSLVSLIYLGFLRETFGRGGFPGPYKYSIESDLSEPINSRLFPVPYEGESLRSSYRDLDEKREIEETRPLCEEERISQSIRELIQSGNSNFLRAGNDFDLGKYNLIPRKVDVIRCVSISGEEKSTAVCKPENCRERKVDVEIFGRLKNETSNTWEFVGTLSAVSVACECFVRWKPQKCSQSTDIFSRF